MSLLFTTLGWGSLVLAGPPNPAADTMRATQATDGQSSPSALDMTLLAAEVTIVETELAKEPTVSRAELLLMFGMSFAGSGDFDLAGAANAMFLNEFGLNQPHSDRAAMRLADCLFPFNFDSINVLHTSSGPRVEPEWRTRSAPQPQRIRLAVTAYELAASIAKDEHSRSQAALRLGWVHRVLGDWESSTKAWDRCSNEAMIPKFAADALWLAAENLEWTNHPAEAAQRLQRMWRQYPQDARSSAAIDGVEQLQAESGRSAEWLTDPVASLQKEIVERARTRSAPDVYRSVVRWLQRRGERTVLIAVSRWACEQDGWAEKDRVRSCYDLADALLLNGDAQSKAEAAERLGEIVAITTDPARVVSAGLRCSGILTDLGRFDEADRMLHRLAERAQGSAKFEPTALAEYATWLFERNELARARDVLAKLAMRYPEYDLSDRFDMMMLSRKEGGR